MNFRILATAMTALFLVACGGGGGGSSGSGSSSSSGSTSSSSGGSLSGTYRMETMQTSATAALQQAQQQGTAGYAWVSAFGSYQSPAQFSDLYLNSNLRQSSTFQYLMDNSPAAMSDLLVQMNLRGGQSYAFKGTAIYGTTAYSIYVKDSAKSATYSYETLTGSVNTSLTNLLAQLNAQGTRGFRWLGLTAASAAPTSFVNLYSKDSSGPATYVYSAISFGASSAPGNATALTQALQQGSSDGSYYLGTVLAGSQFAMIFERPAGSTTATGYTIDSIPANESLSTMLQSINTRAGQGRFFWSDVVTTDGAFHRIYTHDKVLPHPLYGFVYP
jgi:hypothetical protein